MSTRPMSSVGTLLLPLGVLLPAVMLLLLIASPAAVSGLDCVVCGEYNDDGTGAITPCLNYSAALVPRLRKTCPRSEHKFCIKYVSELSVVRDCVEECREKEVWDTRTYCCNEDGCNAAGRRAGFVDGGWSTGVAICLAVGAVLLVGGAGQPQQQPQQSLFQQQRMF